MLEFVQHLVNGLSIGSIYALVALGYTMVFGVLKLVNFAHGDVYMLGAFIGLYTVRFFELGNSPSLWSLLITLFSSMAGCAMVGFFIERLAYLPLRKAPKINVLITAVGISFFLEFSSQMFFGSDPQFFPQIYHPQTQWSFGEVSFNPIQLVIFIISIALMLILQTIIFKTRWGQAMRAVSFNHDLASLMGISTDKVISVTFMLSSALAGAAGVLVGLTYPKIEPMMGVMPGLKAFVAAVLGGTGSILGAVIGAMILGLAEEFLVGYWASTYRDALTFGILILILLFKPTGILGSKSAEKV